MPLPPGFNLDTATPAQLLAVLGTLTVPEFVATRQVLKNRHGIDFPVPTALGVTGPQAAGGAVPGLTTFARQEWLSLIRAGLAWGVGLSIAAAATPAQIQLQLPAGLAAGTRYLIYGVTVSSSVPLALVALRLNAVALGGGVGFLTNLRSDLNGVATSTALFATAGSAALAPSVAIKSILGNSPTDFGYGQGFICEVTQTGNGVFAVHSDSFTGTLNATILWAEIPANYF
jgi:hypothetical protein